MMRFDRLTDRRTVWLALVNAYQEADSMCDAYSWDEDEEAVQINKKRMAAYNRVAVRYFGKPIADALNEPFEDTVLVDARSLSKLLKPE